MEMALSIFIACGSMLGGIVAVLKFLLGPLDKKIDGIESRFEKRMDKLEKHFETEIKELKQNQAELKESQAELKESQAVFKAELITRFENLLSALNKGKV